MHSIFLVSELLPQLNFDFESKQPAIQIAQSIADKLCNKLGIESTGIVTLCEHLLYVKNDLDRYKCRCSKRWVQGV